MATPRRITGRAPVRTVSQAAKPAAPALATPPRAPEPKTVTQSRAAVNAAANEFEAARQAYAAAGDRLNEAQIALARAMAAPK